MANKRIPGLYKRGDVWHMDKKILGRRICESTHAHTLIEAEQYVAWRTEEIRKAKIYGVRPERTFRQASEKFIQENQHKRTLAKDIAQINLLDPFIGEVPLQAIHMGVLQRFILFRQEQGVKRRTINFSLQVVRRILNLASTEWMDEYGLTWLAHAPKIKLLSEDDARAPYPLSWAEQERLFSYFPSHLKNMALFMVNTGCRDKEVCSLRWEWECHLDDSVEESVFLIPGDWVKNGEDRLVVLNRVAQSVINSVRGQHSEYVFTYQGRPIDRMLNSAWKRAREKADLNVRVHDLKHTFGRRLRAAGVCFEDRQDLLGHKSGRITTHYSAAEIEGLVLAANKVCDLKHSTPILRTLRSSQKPVSRKSPALSLVEVKESNVSA